MVGTEVEKLFDADGCRHHSAVAAMEINYLQDL